MRLSLLSVVEISGILFLIAFALTTFGIFVASRLQSMEGFQMIMNFLIVPLFFLSGALFPPARPGGLDEYPNEDRPAHLRSGRVT
ncbi:MAG: ABC transporter permease [Peptococcaceae bacterium]|nr:ABC transporter permease [Peptococcaceae bacterium]